MVSELAGEGVMPPQLPAPASRSLETVELRFRLRKQIRRGSLLRRGVNVTKTIALFSPSFNRSRSVKFLSKVLNNPLFEVFYRSRSVKSSSTVLDSPSVAIIVHGADPWNERVQCSLISLASLIHSAVSSCSAMARACVRRSPTIPIQSSSKVLVNALFIASNCSSWSRSAKCSSKVLVNRTSRSRFVRVLSKLLISSLFTIFNRSRSELISDRVFVEFKLVNKVRNCRSSFRSRSVERTSTAPVNQLSFVFISISLSLNMMYYERFIQVHREKDADITVVKMRMNEKHVIAFGLMKICEGRNIELAEKPKGEQMKAMKVDTTILGLDDEAQKSLHNAFYVVRWNKRFLTAGGERLPQDSPQLYWLWITFLAVDVFFVVIRVAVACIIGIAVCCYLPCIIAILYAVADQEGAIGRIQANMSPEVPLNENLADFLSQAASLMPAFMDSAVDTFPVGHSVSKYVDRVLTIDKENAQHKIASRLLCSNNSADECVAAEFGVNDIEFLVQTCMTTLSSKIVNRCKHYLAEIAAKDLQQFWPLQIWRGDVIISGIDSLLIGASQLYISIMGNQLFRLLTCCHPVHGLWKNSIVQAESCLSPFHSKLGIQQLHAPALGGVLEDIMHNEENEKRAPK
nr:E3 ubiquitin-protein ligase At1g63170-like [Ipomoea batatas]